MAASAAFGKRDGKGRKMIERSESIVALIGALHKAQKSIGGVVRDSKNPHYKNAYASLAAVVEACKEPLLKEGIVFTQALGKVVDDKLEVTTMLMHTSGEWMASTLHVPLGKKDAQGVGSASTYAQRYSLMAMLGLPPVDDDGQAASKGDEPASKGEVAPKPFTATESGLKGSYWVQKIKEAKDLTSLKAINASQAFKDDWQRLQDKDADAITTAYGDRKAVLEAE